MSSNSLGGSWGMEESGSIEQIFYSSNGKYLKIVLTVFHRENGVNFSDL